MGNGVFMHILFQNQADMEHQLMLGSPKKEYA